MTYSAVLPDTEALIAGWLRTHPLLTPFSVTVTSTLHGYTRGAPWVTVARAGGPLDLHGRVDRAVVALQIRAGDRDTASDISQATRIALLDLVNRTSGGGFVCDVTEIAGPSWLPDPSDDSARYVASWEVTLTAA